MKGKCNRCGLCCKYLRIHLDTLTEDERRQVEKHNKCYFYKNNLIILVTCNHLKRKNKRYVCDIHNTGAYPEVCKTGLCVKDTDKGEAGFVMSLLKERRK